MVRMMTPSWLKMVFGLCASPNMVCDLCVLLKMASCFVRIAGQLRLGNGMGDSVWGNRLKAETVCKHQLFRS